jgi:CDP-6-deoxy-D-xylo-4-hexulose-3-dehydrase|tara:strand:- start:245 stop:1534 length:1290 start_codon:yes stop_codon:yes gene_type:complete
MSNKVLETKIYNAIEEYFNNVSNDDLKPSNWKVPIGGGYYDHNEVAAVVECYLHGSLSIQKPVVRFEKAFSDYVGNKHGVACNSGTSANILALNTLLESGDLKKGDEVAMPATTFISVATPVLQLGLKPVYIDVEKDSLNIDVDELEASLSTGNIKCVMVVHTLGCPADMTRIMKLAKEHDIRIIEDCCEAHGAKHSGQMVGSFGDISTWSFYVAHHMTTAEGGMAQTNSDEYATILRELREFGRNKQYVGERYGFNSQQMSDFDERYVFRRIGWNFRMADAPASFGLQQLKKLDEMNSKRVTNAEYLIDNLQKHGEYFVLPTKGNNSEVHSYYSFAITLKENCGFSRKELVHYLESNGVETRAIMCGTLPDQPSLCDAPGRNHGDLTSSRYVRDNSFFVGCHPMLDTEHLDHIVKTITTYILEIKNAR